MKDRRKLLWLVALAAVLVGLNVFSPFSPDAPESGLEVEEAVIGTSQAVPNATFDTEWLEAENRLQAKDVQRNIFEYGRRVVERRPVNPTAPTQAQASTPPPPPPKPKPPFQFFGFAQSAASGGQRVFLTDGENIFVARRGDLVMERYRVTQISEESIQIEDTGGELQWVLPLQQP
jgi:hypothetical protein